MRSETALADTVCYCACPTNKVRGSGVEEIRIAAVNARGSKLARQLTHRVILHCFNAFFCFLRNPPGTLGLDFKDLPESIRNLSIETYRHSPTDIPTLEEQEIHYIKWVLEKSGGNKTRAAKVTGIDRVSLWRKLKRYGIED